MECCKKTIRNKEDKKNIENRMNRIIGQMEGVKRMINDDRYCSDILIQLSAINNSIKSLASIIFDQHLHSCVVNEIKNDDFSSLDELTELFRKF